MHPKLSGGPALICHSVQNLNGHLNHLMIVKPLPRDHVVKRLLLARRHFLSGLALRVLLCIPCLPVLALISAESWPDPLCAVNHSACEAHPSTNKRPGCYPCRSRSKSSGTACEAEGADSTAH